MYQHSFQPFFYKINHALHYSILLALAQELEKFFSPAQELRLKLLVFCDIIKKRKY